jgi:nicotinate phosphoribosyltransferase
MILDTDLYKFTTLQLVYKHFPYTHVKYKLFDRGGDVIKNWSYWRPILENGIDKIHNDVLSFDDINYLKSLNIFDNEFLSSLYNVPLLKYVKFDFNNGVTVSGNWYNCLLWEIPIMQILNEDTTYSVDIKHIINRVDAVSWNNVAEFGTRRRKSKLIQEIVLSRIRHNLSKTYCTSNIDLARKYNFTPVGTYGHEVPMGLLGYYNEENAAINAIKLLKKEFPNRKTYALTDTFTTDHFLQSFEEIINLVDGVRHDSGSPIVFYNKIQEYILTKGTKQLEYLFTDSLNADLIRDIRIKCPKASFGIGTWVTNPYGSSLVVKMIESNGVKVYKLSDNPKKAINVT